MRRVFRLAVLFIVLLGTPLIAETDIIGELVFLSGSVSLVRNNAGMPSPQIGDQIENFDFLETGPGATVEIALYPETGIHAAIIISPNTSLYFDISGLSEGVPGSIELLSGRVDITAGRLTGGNELVLRTAQATMAVRGTEFTVISTIADDVLLAVREGRVECRTVSNTILYSVPGEIVEKISGSPWRNVSLDSTLYEAFLIDWYNSREQSISERTVELLSFYGRRYVELREPFIQAYVRLLNNRDIIQKWMDEDRLGITGTVSERVREKRQVIGGLLNMRMRLIQMERVFIRLGRLLEESRDTPRNTEIMPGLDLRTLRRTYEQDRVIIRRRMREVRYIIKLYTLRNDGVSPFEGIPGALAEEGFANERDFFGE